RDSKALVKGAKLIGNTHAHVTVRRDGSAFGMERNKIKRRADSACRVVRAAQTMFEKFAGESAAAPGGVGATHSGCRQRAAHGIDSEVMQLQEFLRRSAPIPDVRLVPYFPVPGLDLGAPVFLHTMLRPLKDQFRPLRVVFGWVSPACINLIVTGSRCPMVLVRLRLDRKVFRHETNLCVGPDAALKVGVEDAIEDRPVVSRVSTGVLVVGAGRTPL